MQYLGAGLANGAGVDAFLNPETDIALLGITLARVAGARVYLTRGVADDFQDSSGIDAAASTNELYISTGTKGYHAIRPADSVFTNNMTSNSAPSPQTASANSDFGSSFAAWKAFDSDSTSSYWCQATPGVTPAWLRRKLDTARVVTKYRIRCGVDGTPTDWTFRGSNDGSSWTTLDTRTGQSLSSSSDTEYTFSNVTAYLYYEINITGLTSYGSIRQFEFTVTSVLAAMSLRSAAYSASVQPSTASLTVVASTASGTITPNTNLVGYVSRDNGTTWTAVTLAAVLTVGGQTTYAGSAVISGQPSGTAPRYRVDTAVTGSTDITIEAVALQWA